jgi:hypothetical protein
LSFLQINELACYVRVVTRPAPPFDLLSLDSFAATSPFTRTSQFILLFFRLVGGEALLNRVFWNIGRALHASFPRVYSLLVIASSPSF